MALITCEDCGKSISDRAPSCPHCGAPGATAPPPLNHPPIQQPAAAVIAPTKSDQKSGFGLTLGATLDEVRKLVLAKSKELEIPLSAMSKAVGMNATFVHQFIRKGTPRYLPEEVRHKLAKVIGVSEKLLRGRDLQTQPIQPIETTRATAHSTLGSRIREARKRSRFSASEVARQVGVSRAAVSLWEKGQSEPGSRNLKRVAEILDVELEWLGQGNGELIELPKERWEPDEGSGKDDPEARRFRLLRRAEGYESALAWANYLGWSQSGVSFYETGQRRVSRDAALSLLKKVPGFDPVWLWTGDKKNLAFDLRKRIESIEAIDEA